MAHILAATLNELTNGGRETESVNGTRYTQGLTGVNQIGNYFFINTLVAFFFILCGCCLLLRMYNISNNYLRQLLTAGAGSERHQIFSRNRTIIWPWIKRHVLYAPLFRQRHNREIQLTSAVSLGTLPSRFHTILLSVYVLSNISYCFVLDYSKENRVATIAELRGRSGALAAVNLLPTILFALRNNPFIPLLQVSYDTFNLFHRWTARMVIIESTIHICAWAANAVDVGGAPYMTTLLSKSPSFQWGAVAAVAFIIIGVQAWSPVRHAFYETFLTGHRILVLVALIAVYVHLDTGHLPQLLYIWLGGIMWISEWVFRSSRIIFYNYRRQRQTTVVVEAFETGACRLTFDLVRPWKFRPGCHVHVYLPRIGLWASHPFSVAWAKELQRASLEEKLPTSEINLDAEDEIRTSMSLIVRARDGMTRKLYERASAAPNRIITMHGAIEGPYGGHESLDSYGTVVLFAAGVGITHQLGYVRHLLDGANGGTVSARKIILVWSIPNKECMEWVTPWMDEILAMPGRREFLHVYNYISKGSEVRVVSGSGTVETRPGRCEPQQIVDQAFVERVGAMVVTVCGPGVFADSVRHAARKRAELGSLDFIEEAFTY